MKASDHVDSAIVRLWDTCWANPDNEDENLVSLAQKVADSVSDFLYYDGQKEDVDLAFRCYIMAQHALAD
jgi:hypothetical protein